MARQRLRVRRLSNEEGCQLQRIVRRGGGKTDKSIVKWRRSMVVLASARGSIRTLVDSLAKHQSHPVVIGREPPVS
jgi:hypothetical protein